MKAFVETRFVEVDNVSYPIKRRTVNTMPMMFKPNQAVKAGSHQGHDTYIVFTEIKA